METVAELERRLSAPVHLDNDANVGALGEATFGAGRGCAGARVPAGLSAGIGAGLVVDGRPFRGFARHRGGGRPCAVDPQGPICRCGNRGCLETFVAGPALCELLRKSHGPLTVRELVELASAGDPGATRVVADAARIVGRAVADLCNTLNPDVVIVGGDLSAAGDVVLGPLREAVRRFAIPAAADAVRIVPSELGDRAELLGALALGGPRGGRPTVLTDPRFTHHYRRRRHR